MLCHSFVRVRKHYLSFHSSLSTQYLPHHTSTLPFSCCPFIPLSSSFSHSFTALLSFFLFPLFILSPEPSPLIPSPLSLFPCPRHFSPTQSLILPSHFSLAFFTCLLSLSSHRPSFTLLLIPFLPSLAPPTNPSFLISFPFSVVNYTT